MDVGRFSNVPEVIVTDLPDLAEFAARSSSTELTHDPTNLAALGHFQRMLSRPAQEAIEQHFRSVYREFIKSPDLASFPPLRHLSADTRDQVFAQLLALSLTVGCNAGFAGGCIEWCGALAIPGVKQHIPFPVFEEIVARYGRILARNQTGPNWASDVSDYVSKRYDGSIVHYRDVQDFFLEKTGFAPFVSTTFATGSLERMRGVKINRIHISDPHSPRLKQAVEEHPEAQLAIVDVINAGLPFGGRFSAYGIACGNGMLIDPRGVYSIVLSFGRNRSAPQHEFVVPFIGDRPFKPEVGDDIRVVLSQNIPKLSWWREPFGVHLMMELCQKHYMTSLGSLTSVALFENPERPSETLIVKHRDNIVVDVQPVDSYVLSRGVALNAETDSCLPSVPKRLRSWINSLRWFLVQLDSLTQELTAG